MGAESRKPLVLSASFRGTPMEGLKKDFTYFLFCERTAIIVILIDTREKAPLSFNQEHVSGTERRTLNVGDYSCRFNDGYIPKVSFERKNLSDLYGSLCLNHSRFQKELERAKEQDIKLILIIEGTLTKVYKGVSHSVVTGASVIKTIFSLWIRYQLVPVFCKDRTEMSNYIYEYFAAIGRKRIKDLKEKDKTAVLPCSTMAAV